MVNAAFLSRRFGKPFEQTGKNEFYTQYAAGSGKEHFLVTVYRVFPGIELLYHCLQAGSFTALGQPDPHLLEIDHCRTGQVESRKKNSCCFFSAGDLAAFGGPLPESTVTLTGGSYTGISILIHTAQTPQCLSCLLDDVTVSPTLLLQKFSCSGKAYIARSNNSIAHIFSELYTVPEEIKKGYFKVKVLELLLFLSALEVQRTEVNRHYATVNQTQLAHKIAKHLKQNLNRRITIEQLSDQFHTSPTGIKNGFKAVYGTSIYSFARRQKMLAAAKDLCTTNCSVLEIAGKYGYDNGSKFAKAFGQSLGLTPGNYRKLHSGKPPLAE